MSKVDVSRVERARWALEGLSVGDAFGEQFFYLTDDHITRRTIPPAPWWYTDDTNMALSIVEILCDHGTIHQDQLARSFAERYDSDRGYGMAMHFLLRDIRQGQSWRERAHALFEGTGSFGNGAAMRVAPLGAFFADDLETVVIQARLSAEVTHTHPEGIAGAIAVAVATALAWRARRADTMPGPREFLEQIISLLPKSLVQKQIRQAARLPRGISTAQAAARLGNGSNISAHDTVPFTLWCAANYLSDYETALWQTVSGLGDMDTTCAIVGGITVMYTGEEGIPIAWRQAREPLPDG